MGAAIRKSVSLAVRRQFSTQPRLCSLVYDHSNPAALERASDPLSDSLAAKEKGPWTELNNEDKIALYHSQFPQTMVESEKQEPEAGRIVVGVTVAVLFFAWLKVNVGPQAPITITDEWRTAQQEKMKLYQMNPITGISSKQ